MKRICVLTIFLLVIVITTGVVSADWRPTVTVPKLDASELELDGVLNDALWVNASLANSKIVVDLFHTNDAITELLSVAYLAYDDENLYVAAINYDDPPSLTEGIRWGGGARGGMEINFWLNNVLHTIYAFPSGKVYFGRGGIPGGDDMLKMGSAIIEYGWVFEIVIPFASVDTDTPKEGDSWMFNVGGLSDQWKAWKSTGGPNYDVLEAGTLVFGGLY